VIKILNLKAENKTIAESKTTLSTRQPTSRVNAIAPVYLLKAHTLHKTCNSLLIVYGNATFTVVRRTERLLVSCSITQYLVSYTWDAVTSVNLNISMVGYWWCHLVCTTDINALIVWKTLIDICFSIKSSLLALTAAYTKFRRMMWSLIFGRWYMKPSVTFPDVYCYLIETPGDFTGKSWKHVYNFVISGWVKPLHVVRRNSGYDSHNANPLPLFFPHPPIRLRNDLYCVGWGVKLYSLTHSSDFCPFPF